MIPISITSVAVFLASVALLTWAIYRFAQAVERGWYLFPSVDVQTEPEPEPPPASEPVRTKRVQRRRRRVPAEVADDDDDRLTREWPRV